MTSDTQYSLHGASSVSIFCAGDVLNTSIENGLVCTKAVEDVIRRCDYAVCNFEGPISGVGALQAKAGINLCQKEQTISGLKAHGFDLLLLANNHMMDFGPEALSATLRAIDAQDMDRIGAGMTSEEAYRPLIISIAGRRIGFINACENQYGALDHHQSGEQAGYAWINHASIDKLIVRTKKDCEILFFFAHAGLEHVNIPQLEWRARYRHLCDLGVDCLIGSHPHVPQGYERYGNSIIVYSLGNFYMDSPRYAQKSDYSYSAIITLAEINSIDIDFLYHHKAQGQVQVTQSSENPDIQKLNALLDDGYLEALDRISQEVFSTKLKTHFNLAINRFSLGLGIKQLLRYLAMLIFQKERSRQKANRLFLHLIKNESFRYVVERALSNSVRNA